MIRRTEAEDKVRQRMVASCGSDSSGDAPRLESTMAKSDCFDPYFGHCASSPASMTTPPFSLLTPEKPPKRAVVSCLEQHPHTPETVDSSYFSSDDDDDDDVSDTALEGKRMAIPPPLPPSPRASSCYCKSALTPAIELRRSKSLPAVTHERRLKKKRRRVAGHFPVAPSTPPPRSPSSRPPPSRLTQHTQPKIDITEFALEALPPPLPARFRTVSESVWDEKNHSEPRRHLLKTSNSVATTAASTRFKSPPPPPLSEYLHRNFQRPLYSKPAFLQDIGRVKSRPLYFTPGSSLLQEEQPILQHETLIVPHKNEDPLSTSSPCDVKALPQQFQCVDVNLSFFGINSNSTAKQDCEKLEDLMGEKLLLEPPDDTTNDMVANDSLAGLAFVLDHPRSSSSTGSHLFHAS